MCIGFMHLDYWSFAESPEVEECRSSDAVLLQYGVEYSGSSALFMSLLSTVTQ